MLDCVLVPDRWCMNTVMLDQDQELELLEQTQREHRHCNLEMWRFLAQRSALGPKLLCG